MTRTLKSDRTYGIEIEAYNVDQHHLAAALEAAGVACQVQGYNHSTATCWKLVNDGSIGMPQSFELVSPPLQGEDGLAQIRTVCRVLHEVGARVARTCGLHVHHAAGDLTLQQWKNLICNWLKYEPAFDQLQPPSRRGSTNSYCRAIRSNFASLDVAFTTVKRARTVEELARVIAGHDRYYKLNMMAFWRHGTVEFRHHSGTIEAEKIIAWVSMTQHLLEDAVAVAYVLQRGADCLKSLLATIGVPARVQKFYQARAAHFAAQAA